MIHARPFWLWALLGLWVCSAGSVSDDSTWAFNPIRDAELPAVRDVTWARNPIDAFILAGLESGRLSPAPMIDRRTFIRRATYDLLGLPPTPAEVREFVAHPSPSAETALVDRLLASPNYGERWGRHWLDVVRYADTDGFAIDGERSTLWRYRDYVVRSFNEGRPFDRFVREQIAGEGTEGVVATGFYRLGPWEADNMIPENKRQDYLNEITGTIGTGFLGLTIGCARCHDHKYDPISAKDFYRLQAFLAPLKRADVPVAHSETELLNGLTDRKARAEAELVRRKKGLEEFREHLTQKLAVHRSEEVGAVNGDALEKALGEEQPFSQEEKDRFASLKTAVSE